MFDVLPEKLGGNGAARGVTARVEPWRVIRLIWGGMEEREGAQNPYPPNVRTD